MTRLLWILLSCISLRLFSQPVIPTPDHIVILILENHSFNQIIQSKEAPNINTLARSSNTALFTQSYGVTYSSQPNYIALFSGCNQGVTDDSAPAAIPFSTENLASQLINAGKTFISYAEDLPQVGYNGEYSGHYVRRHNPAVYWMGNGNNQLPAAVIQPFSSFPVNFSLLPTVCYVIPGNDNNMHDGSISKGDKWIYDHLFGYIQWAKTHNSLFILTFDEDDQSQNNQVATLFCGEMVKSGNYSQRINHISVLRTIEDMYGLPYACDASKAEPVSGCWDMTIGSYSGNTKNFMKVIHNPALHTIRIMISEDSMTGNLKFDLLNIYGEKLEETTISSSVTTIQTNKLSAGVYIFKLTVNNTLIEKGKIVLP